MKLHVATLQFLILYVSTIKPWIIKFSLMQSLIGIKYRRKKNIILMTNDFFELLCVKNFATFNYY